MKGHGINRWLRFGFFNWTDEKGEQMAKKYKTASLGYRPSGGVGVSDEHGWLTAEAKRRNCSIAQVVKDACRAYRKLEPAAAPVPEPDVDTSIVPVSF